MFADHGLPVPGQGQTFAYLLARPVKEIKKEFQSFRVVIALYNRKLVFLRTVLEVTDSDVCLIRIEMSGYRGGGVKYLKQCAADSTH